MFLCVFSKISYYIARFSLLQHSSREIALIIIWIRFHQECILTYDRLIFICIYILFLRNNKCSSSFPFKIFVVLIFLVTDTAVTKMQPCKSSILKVERIRLTVFLNSTNVKESNVE